MKQRSLKNNYLVGLTGGIGSGKSTVALVFKGLGIPVFNADLEVKSLYSEHSIKAKIIQKFGGNVYSGNDIDIKEMARIVFENKSKLNELEKILYPALKEKFQNWINSRSTFPYLIKEAALLIEKGTYKELDKIIHVSAPEDIRISRVMKRSDISRDEVIKRIDQQYKEEEKLNYFDYNILNYDNHSTVKQIIEIHSELLDLAKKVK